jgi:protein-tyrosine phosphatase
MSIDIFWISTDATGRLGIMPRPNGGEWLDREIRDLCSEGVEILVSLLEGAEIWEFQLEALEDRCREVRIKVHSFPIRDQDVPQSAGRFGTLTQELARDVAEGRSVVVHCEHGISRSSMIAAGVLARLGVPVADGLAVIGRVRGLSVPNSPCQADWLKHAVAGWKT